jgi:ribose 5-phosphate isomerase A
MDKKELKKLLGIRAVDALVRDGIKLGLGTGSTAIEVVKYIVELRRKGRLKNLVCVATSLQTEFACFESGIPIYTLNDSVVGGKLDLTIDGADEVDDNGYLIKGGGGALLVEKILAAYSDTYAIVIDSEKRVRNLGVKFPVPVEVMPIAYLPVSKRLLSLGATITVRQGDKIVGPALTKQGNIILDVLFAEPFDPVSMEKKINEIPGVVENGIFTIKVTDYLIIDQNGKIEHSHEVSLKT